MAHEPKDVQQRAPIDDSTAVVLHARKTTFVMLIVTALVVIGILVEDVSRLKRAVDDADTIQGLMNLWRSETRDKDGPVSVAHILAGPVSAAPGAKRRFRLGLAPSSDSKGDALISCTVGLDLGQRFFVPENGQVQKIVVRASNKFESGREINVEWRSYSGEARWTEWLLKQPPYNLRSFSKFWDMLVSSGGSARVNATEIKKYLLRGLSAFDEDIQSTPHLKRDIGWSAVFRISRSQVSKCFRTMLNSMSRRSRSHQWTGMSGQWTLVNTASR